MRSEDQGADWGVEQPREPRTVADGTIRDTMIGTAIVVVLALLATVFALLWVTDAQALSRVELGFYDGFESAGEPGGEVPDYCTHSLVFPAGWVVDAKTWTQAFSGKKPGNPQAFYPNGVSWPIAIGAQKGHITIVEFTPNAFQSVNAYFDQVQSRPQDNYRSRPARSMFVGLSPCGADLRPPNPLAADPFERPACRMIENSGSLTWTDDPHFPSACQVQGAFIGVPAPKLWLTFAVVDPSDGLDLDEHTCMDVPNSAEGCDVGIVFQSSDSVLAKILWGHP